VKKKDHASATSRKKKKERAVWATQNPQTPPVKLVGHSRTEAGWPEKVYQDPGAGTQSTKGGTFPTNVWEEH